MEGLHQCSLHNGIDVKNKIKCRCLDIKCFTYVLFPCSFVFFLSCSLINKLNFCPILVLDW